MPYAVRFDAPAALNRPGARRRLAAGRRAPGAARGAPAAARGASAAAAGDAGRRGAGGRPAGARSTSRAGAAERDIDAVAYAGYPRKRGLDAAVRRLAACGAPGERLVIGGIDRAQGLAWLERCGVPEPAGVSSGPGTLPREGWLELVARARVFVNASRWEDHGLAQLEALPPARRS